MANRSLQNPSSVSEKKPSRLPIFRTVIPRNSIIGCTVAPTNPKLASQNVPIRSRTGTFSGNKLPSLDQRKEDVIKSNERIPEKSIPQKSFLPVRCNNNTTCKIREPARSQISYVQQRARTQVKAKPELRQPSITSQRKESKPGQGTLSLKLSRQRTFAGDASESTNTSPESKSQKHSKESALLSLPQSTDHPILPTCEGSKSPSCTLNSSVQTKINENEANNREGSAVEMIPEGSDLNAVENCYFHQEGQINIDCTKQESNIQEKLPKSAGYVQKEREDDSFFTTNSSHYISTKNTSRYSYTMKTHSIGSPGVENNSSADRESKSLEKVTSSIKIGIIETKSPSLMESSDSSDLEAIELLNNCHFFHVPDSVNDIYAYLEYQKSSLVKESGIANIKTPTLQSSEEVVSKTMEKLCNMYPSSSSIKNMQLETNSLTRLGNNESADCDEERLREVLEDDWVIVNKAEGATIINPPSSQEVDDSPNNANDKTYVTSTNEVIGLCEPKLEATAPEEHSQTAVDTNVECNAIYRRDNGLVSNADKHFQVMDANSVEEVKENAATNCTKCILPSTVQDDDGRTTEITICTTNRIKTCSASTSYNIMSSAENAINDLNDGRSEKVETTSAISNDVIQRVESARVEDIMPPRSLNSQKQKQNNSTILKSPSEALPSENSSTISLRTSEGMPFAVSSMSLQVARLLSQCEALQRSFTDKPNKERNPVTLDCSEGVQVSELPPRSRSQKVYNTTRAQDPDKNTVFGEPTKRMDKSRTRPHTINNPSNEGTRSKQRSKSSKPTEAPTQTRTSRVNEKLSNPSSATMLMHGYGSMQSPCLSCRMKTSKDYDNTSEGKKRKAVYFNPDLLPPSSKQIDSNGASVCLRRQSSQDMLPLHFSHLVIDSTVSMYSVGSHLEGFLRIQNNSTSHICYRVTSFIPGRYQIIPSTGILEKNQTVALTIASSVPKMFIKFEPDQFQVETIIAPPDVVAPNEQRLLWKETPPSQIQKALVGRIRIRNPSDSRFEAMNKDKIVNASTSYGDGIVVKRVQQVRGHPQKQGVADICICTIILGILAAAIHRFSSSISDY